MLRETIRPRGFGSGRRRAGGTLRQRMGGPLAPTDAESRLEAGRWLCPEHAVVCVPLGRVGRASVCATDHAMSLIVSWVLSAGAIWVTAELLPGFTVRKGPGPLLLVAAILGLLNALLGWLMLLLIGLATLGIGWLIWPVTQCFVTAILLVITDELTDALEIASFKLALAGAVVMTVIHALGMRVLGY